MTSKLSLNFRGCINPHDGRPAWEFFSWKKFSKLCFFSVVPRKTYQQQIVSQKTTFFIKCFFYPQQYPRQKIARHFKLTHAMGTVPSQIPCKLQNNTQQSQQTCFVVFVFSSPRWRNFFLEIFQTISSYLHILEDTKADCLQISIFRICFKACTLRIDSTNKTHISLQNNLNNKSLLLLQLFFIQRNSGQVKKRPLLLLHQAKSQNTSKGPPYDVLKSISK